MIARTYGQSEQGEFAQEGPHRFSLGQRHEWFPEAKALV